MRYLCYPILFLLAMFQIDAATYGRGQEPYRLAIAFDPAGATVELDDNSVWRVDGFDSRNNVRYWQPNDPVVIYPVVYTYLTGTRFYLHNQRTRTNANAELSLGPTVGGSCNNRIIYIDYAYGEVRLQDGQGFVSVWIADQSDLHTMQSWRLYQSVILGSNNSWPANWSSHCQSILINVENNNYIRGQVH